MSLICVDNAPKYQVPVLGERYYCKNAPDVFRIPVDFKPASAVFGGAYVVCLIGAEYVTLRESTDVMLCNFWNHHLPLGERATHCTALMCMGGAA